MAIETLVFERTMFEISRPKNGRPSFALVEGYYAIINGSRQYPPMRCREARRFASDEGFSFVIAGEPVAVADR
jgi:hypothetical protein